jgi:hypothetical protein
MFNEQRAELLNSLNNLDQTLDSMLQFTERTNPQPILSTDRDDDVGSYSQDPKASQHMEASDEDIQLLSSAQSGIYLHSLNQLRLPGTGQSSVLKVSGAEYELSDGILMLVPHHARIQIKLLDTQGRTLIDTSMVCLKIPPPTTRIFADRQEISDGILPLSTQEIIIGLYPDNRYRSNCPQDASFGPSEFKASLIRNGMTLATRTYFQNYLEISSLGLIPRSGDELIIEVTAVFRKNYNSDQVDHPDFNRFHTFKFR